MICDSWSSYEQKAVYLATNPQALADILAVLQNREQLPLFQIKEWVFQLELAYQRVWHNLCLNPAKTQG